MGEIRLDSASFKRRPAWKVLPTALGHGLLVPSFKSCIKESGFERSPTSSVHKLPVIFPIAVWCRGHWVYLDMARDTLKGSFDEAGCKNCDRDYGSASDRS